MSSGTLRTQKGKQAEQKRGLLMMEFRHVRQFPECDARPSRTNWPSISGPSIGLGNEWQSVFLRLVAAAATAAPLLMPACRVSPRPTLVQAFQTLNSEVPVRRGAQARKGNQ